MQALKHSSRLGLSSQCCWVKSQTLYTFSAMQNSKSKAMAVLFFHSVSTSNLLLLDRARFHAHSETYSSAETWTSPGGQVGRRPYTAGLCPKSCIFGMEVISTAWLKEWCGLLKGTWRLVNLWKPSHSSSTATSSSLPRAATTPTCLSKWCAAAKTCASSSQELRPV